MRVVIAALVVLALSAPANAQQPVESFETLGFRVKSGDTVFVTDTSARETTGTLVKIAATTMTIVVEGQARDITSLDVRQIAKRGDSVKNGFLIGAAIGGAIAAGVLAAPCSEYCDGDPQIPASVIVVASVLEFGGIGALIDYFIKGRTVVYRTSPRATVQIMPLVLTDNRGIRVSVTF